MAVHGTNEWLVFDDSKLHKAANESQVNIGFKKCSGLLAIISFALSCYACIYHSPPFPFFFDNDPLCNNALHTPGESLRVDCRFGAARGHGQRARCGWAHPRAEQPNPILLVARGKSGV